MVDDCCRNETETEIRIAELITELVELLPFWDSMVYIDMSDAQASELAANITGEGVLNNGRTE